MGDSDCGYCDKTEVCKFAYSAYDCEIRAQRESLERLTESFLEGLLNIIKEIQNIKEKNVNSSVLDNILDSILFECLDTPCRENIHLLEIKELELTSEECNKRISKMDNIYDIIRKIQK